MLSSEYGLYRKPRYNVGILVVKMVQDTLSNKLSSIVYLVTAAKATRSGYARVSLCSRDAGCQYYAVKQLGLPPHNEISFHSRHESINNMAPTRNHMTLDTKYKAILEVEKGAVKKLVAEKFGIPSSTLSTWLKQKDAIKARCEAGTVGPKAKAMKAGQFEKTEQAILQYILEARASNLELSGTLIKIKAEQFAKKFGENRFCASNGWLDCLKSVMTLS